jgi:PAS domain-containing protein
LSSLESHAKTFEETNQPIPNVVKILLQDARHNEEKHCAKRISNRKSATVARARKRQLIDELTVDNGRMRRQALILSYLPDPVIAIGLDGEIKFCNMQAARVLKHKMKDLEGARINDVLVPESRPVMSWLIQYLVTVERIAAARVRITESECGENGEDQSFIVKEVNVNGNDENVTDSSGVRGGSRFDTSSNDKPPSKKSKTAVNGDKNVDDVHREGASHHTMYHVRVTILHGESARCTAQIQIRFQIKLININIC